MKGLIIVSLIIVTLFGCSNDNAVTVIPKYDYTIEQTRSCFCPNSDKIVKLFVLADTITYAIWVSDGSQLTEYERNHYRTIKQLFEEMNNCDTTIFNINVEYDLIYGYPSVLSFYPKDGTLMDVWVEYKTYNYKRN